MNYKINKYIFKLRTRWGEWSASDLLNYNGNHLSHQRRTHFPKYMRNCKILGPQIVTWQRTHTNIRHHHGKFSYHDDTTPGVCAPMYHLL